MVNLQDTPSDGPLAAADVAQARQHSTGTVRLVPAGCGNQGRWPERRVNWPDTMPVQPAEACTDVGHHDAAESMWRHRRVSESIRCGLALALLLVVVGYLMRAIWPVAGA